ncbi:MAG: hypothetical protein ACRDHK_12750, partial [Actinomycetota bacterium]
YELDAEAGEFTVQDCPAVLASVVVTVQACPPTSSTTRPVLVTIGPEGAASVTITGPDGFNQVITGAGAALDLAPGDYAWSATANPTFEIVGASEGTFGVGSCVVKVLATTGADLGGLGIAGVMVLLLGAGMVALSNRRVPVLVGLADRHALVQRLRGRSVWWMVMASWTTVGPVRRIGRRGGRSAP